MSERIIVTVGRQLGSGGREIAKTLAAVSYTHLDVYKRQPRHRGGDTASK